MRYEHSTDSLQYSRHCTFHQTIPLTPQYTNDSTWKLLVTKICTKQRTQPPSSPKFTGACSSAQSRVPITPKFTGCTQLGPVQGLVVYHKFIERKSMCKRNWSINLLRQEQSQHIIFVEVGAGQTRRQHDVQVHRKYIPVRLSNRQTMINILQLIFISITSKHVHTYSCSTPDVVHSTETNSTTL